MTSFHSDELARFCAEVLAKCGLNTDDAFLVSDSLVESNLRGVDSHGIARLPHYIQRLQLGSIQARPEIRVDELGPSAARVDGGHGLGQIVMYRAAAEAIQMAKQTGAGWAAVANSNHCGALSYYGLRISDAGMIGLVFTHVGSLVLPYGSAEPFCGTNPVCVTAPGRDGQAICLDMATSIRPWNALKEAERKGEAIPEGWGVDHRGRATTVAADVAAIAPVGSYKGSGLGLVIDMLCSLLSGSPFGPDIPLMYGDLTQRRRLGGLVGAIDIATFLSVDEFQRRLSDMLSRWGVLQPTATGKKVLYPGEPEMICRAERISHGIPLDGQVIAELNQLAQDCQVPPISGAE